MKGEGEQGSETANHRKKKNKTVDQGFHLGQTLWSIYHHYLCYHKLRQHLVVCVCVCVTGQAHFSQSVG